MRELLRVKAGISIISADAYVLPTAVIGEGSFIGRWSTVSDNVTVGKHVVTHSFSVIGHDAIVKDYGTLVNAAFFGGSRSW